MNKASSKGQWNLPLQRADNPCSAKRELKKTFQNSHVSSIKSYLNVKQMPKANALPQENIAEATINEESQSEDQEEIIDIKNEFFEYDLPCKRSNFMEYEHLSTNQQTEENRPVQKKGIYFQHHKMSVLTPNHHQDRSPESDNNLPKFSQRSPGVEHQEERLTQMRKKVDTIYERLIESQEKTKNKQYKPSEATFKPKDLNQQISDYRRWQETCRGSSAKKQVLRVQPEIVKKIMKSASAPKRNSENMSTRSHVKSVNYHGVINYAREKVRSQTKYQKILDQYFSSNQKQQLDAEETYRSKGSLHKQLTQEKRQTHNSAAVAPSYSLRNLSRNGNNSYTESNKKMQTPSDALKQVNKTNVRQKVIERLFHKKQQFTQFEVSGRDKKLSKAVPDGNNNRGAMKRHNSEQKQFQSRTHRETTQNISHIPEPINSERWMAMSFHDRQKRVLESRHKKEEIGKKQKLAQEIKPCTFKPSLTKTNANSNSQVALKEKQSYLQHYYQKLHRRY